jgi:hypothetical protein
MDLLGILNNEGWVIFFKVWCKSSFRNPLFEQAVEDYGDYPASNH